MVLCSSAGVKNGSLLLVLIASQFEIKSCTPSLRVSVFWWSQWLLACLKPVFLGELVTEPAGLDLEMADAVLTLLSGDVIFTQSSVLGLLGLGLGDAASWWCFFLLPVLPSSSLRSRLVTILFLVSSGSLSPAMV